MDKTTAYYVNKGLVWTYLSSLNIMVEKYSNEELGPFQLVTHQTYLAK